MGLKTRISLALAALAGAALAGAFYAFEEGYLRFNYPSRSEFPIQGIDVSHHQGAIDWKTVKAQGIDFAFIKATEGENFKDSDFEKNWKSAQEAGITVGAYHYFTFCRSGVDQANNFIATVPVVSFPVLPPVIDLEFGGNCAKEPQKADLFTDLHLFEKRVKAHFGRKPVYYVTREFYRAYLSDGPITNDLWVRNIFFRPHLSEQHRWVFWQYANRGRLQGIDGPVDLNVFSGSSEEWKNYLNGL